MSDNIDINIDNYNSNELYDILDITENTCKAEIIKKTNNYIKKFNSEGKKDLVKFFQNIKARLLSESEEDEFLEDYYNEVNEEDNPIKFPAFQDKKLNPRNIKTTDILLNVDSAFRKNSAEPTSNYNASLSETITDVVSLQLNSIELKHCWYAFDTNYGNTSMYIDYYFQPSDVAESTPELIIIKPLFIQGSDGSIIEKITTIAEGFNEDIPSTITSSSGSAEVVHNIISSDFDWSVKSDGLDIPFGTFDDDIYIDQYGDWTAEGFPGAGNVRLVKGITAKFSFSLNDRDFSSEYDVQLNNGGEVGIVFGYNNGNYKAINLLIDSSDSSNNALRYVDVNRSDSDIKHKYSNIVESTNVSSSVNGKLLNFKIEREKGESVLVDNIKVTISSKNDASVNISHTFDIVENFTITNSNLSLDNIINEVKEEEPPEAERFPTTEWWKTKPDKKHIYSVILNNGDSSYIVGKLIYSINKWEFAQELAIQDRYDKNLSVRMQLTGNIGLLTNGTSSTGEGATVVPGVLISNFKIKQNSEDQNNDGNIDNCYNKKRFCICIPNGNYVVTNNNNSNNVKNLIDEINTSINLQFVNSSDVDLLDDTIVFSYDQSTHKTTITNNHTVQDSFFEIIFYDSQQPFCNDTVCIANTQCNNCSCTKYSKLNSNLGWNLGFRPDYKLLDQTVNVKFSVYLRTNRGDPDFDPGIFKNAYSTKEISDNYKLDLLDESNGNTSNVIAIEEICDKKVLSSFPQNSNYIESNVRSIRRPKQEYNDQSNKIYQFAEINIIINCDYPEFDENELSDTVESDTIIDIYGPKYLLLVVDEFARNRVSKNCIGITNETLRVSLPDYYNEERRTVNGVEPQQQYVSDTEGFTKPVDYLYPSFPRLFTQAQLYTINEIKKENHEAISNTYNSPLLLDIIAKIPIKVGSTNSYQNLFEQMIEFTNGDNLFTNERIYKGPVNIERLKITVTDEKGNLINFNNFDWSFTLMAKKLYHHND